MSMEGLFAKYGAQKAYVAHTNCPESLPICLAVAVSPLVTISAPSAPFMSASSAPPSLSSALPAAPPVDALLLPETVTSSTFEAYRASGASIPPQANSMQSSGSPSTDLSVSQQRFIQFVSTPEGWQAIVTMIEAIQQRIGVDVSRVYHM